MRIIVTGLVAQHPELGGMTWHYLQYLVGLRDLGHDVYYFEDSGEWPYSWDGGESGEDWNLEEPTPNIHYLATVMNAFGFANRWAYNCATDSTWYGLDDRERNAIVESADVLLNVSGSLVDVTRYHSVGRRVYIDTDPVFTQLALDLGDGARREAVSAHDVHFTFATDLSSVTDAGLHWLPTRQPIALGEWAFEPPPTSRYTTIMNWTSYEPIRWHDQLYGQKDLEFVHYLDMPRRLRTSAIEMEVALPSLQHAEWEHADLDGGSEDLAADTATSLAAAGWHAVDAIQAANGFSAYRDYIVGSKAEWTVAKNGYVRAQCGWFSERSACYLAAGRPVIAQDTGFSASIPSGLGLLAFSNPDEGVAAIEQVEADYPAHARAARELAAEYFAAPKVLDEMLRVMQSPTAFVPAGR